MARLSGQDIINKYRLFADDTLDTDLELQLVNDAKDEIESEVGYAPNEAVNASNSTVAGQTYLTAETLPTDFLSFARPYIFVGTYKYYLVPISDKIKFKDTPYKAYYDPADGLHLCGTQNSAQTIYIPYIKQSDDIALDTYPNWPAKFHALIPYWIASIFYPIEAGDPNRAWTPQWEARFQRLLNQFKDWNVKMKLNSAGGRTNYRDDGDEGIPLGQM